MKSLRYPIAWKTQQTVQQYLKYGVEIYDREGTIRNGLAAIPFPGDCWVEMTRKIRESSTSRILEKLEYEK